MNNNVETMDRSAHKYVRREILHELTVRREHFLATDYPGPKGREFIRKLHRDRPGLLITLVNKYSFKRDYPGDTLANVVTKVRKDIFDVMQTHPAEIVDIDLFGGLPASAVDAIEKAPNWRRLFLTFSRTWRHRSQKGALMHGEDPAVFMELWCKRNGWKSTMAQLPYRRHNRKRIMGIEDDRGPQYWTFLIER